MPTPCMPETSRLTGIFTTFVGISNDSFISIMRLIKRLHIFILESFLPLFAMTFFIVLFIVLMQFLWKYIDDFIGKGLPLSVLAEFFFYAAVSLVPMALPLAILLASLMTFGNLGENLELTALKSSGISLIKVMAPLIVLVSGVAVGAFFFQNNVLPKAQVKMWTLLFSMKQKSPEVEIPEGIFYDQIPGYNLYVAEKDQETGMLYGMMIYDVNRGGDNSTIIMADSARIAFTRDSKYLFLHLYNGEQFENLRDMSMRDRNVPFRRETFIDKEVLIPFDANFNRLDDDNMRRQYVGKNITELQHTIDSVGTRVDSLSVQYGQMLRRQPLAGLVPDRGKKGEILPFRTVKMPSEAIHLDTLMAAMTPTEGTSLYDKALRSVLQKRQNYEFHALTMSEDKRIMRRHEIELLKKFTLSVACIIFFFIGAPLGAIIRKGGLGTPLVISVFLFLFYYIIDNTGYKMARDGRWDVWFGIWLSTFVLVPLGCYVTIKAMNDSAVFDKDAYINFFRRLVGARVARNVEQKAVILREIDTPTACGLLTSLREHALQFKSSYCAAIPTYHAYWHKEMDMTALDELAAETDAAVNYMRDCSDIMVTHKLPDFPVIRNLWIYNPTSKTWLRKTMEIALPFGIPVWLVARRYLHELQTDIDTICTLSTQIEEMIGCDAQQSVSHEA